MSAVRTVAVAVAAALCASFAVSAPVQAAAPPKPDTTPSVTAASAARPAAGSATSRVVNTRAAKNDKRTKLAIKVAGVPGGAIARVKVTGPAKFKKSLTRSTTYSRLKAGTYKIKAAAVAAPGGTAKPTKTSLSVKVKARKTAKATIRYTFVAAPVIPPSVTAPGSVSNVHATSRNKSVVLTWSAPASTGGATITDYVIEYSPDGGASWVPFSDGVSSSTTATVTGLTNGVEYVFRISAVNSAGTSPTTAPPPVVPAPTEPDAPSGVDGTRHNASVSLTWDAPDANGSDITDYVIEYQAGTSATWTPFTHNTPIVEPRTATVTGLTNGTSYVFRVGAVNSVGTSAFSPVSQALVPATVPDPVGTVAGTASNHEVALTWPAPLFDGGAPVADYVVEYSNTTTVSGWLTFSHAVSATRAVTVTGLTNYDSYDFRVAASNVIGTGAAGAGLTGVSPLAVAPGRPLTVTGVSHDESATVSWSAPADDGGAAVTSYLVTASPATPGLRTCPWASGPLTCTVTGLTNGVSYTFSGTATNREATSLASIASAAVVPSRAPDAPTTVSAVGGEHQATVTWVAPAQTNGAAITSYTVTAASLTTAVSETCTTTSAAQRSCIVAGLRNGFEYTFTVTARNVAGDSVASAASSGATPAGQSEAPRNVAGAFGNQAVTVTWDAPESDGGNPITAYAVTPAHTGSGANGTGCSPVSVLTRSCLVTGLTNGVSYTFTVVGTTNWGPSLTSSSSAGVVPKTAPSQPAITSVVAHDASVIVTWTAPTDDGGATVDEYTVTSLASSGTHDVRTCTVPALTCTIEQLDNHTPYTFTVTAKNSAGTGSPSVASSAATPLPVPSAPGSVGGVSADSKVVVTWTAADGNGSPVTGYDVAASPLSATGTGKCTTAGLLTCEVTDLVNGTSYTFTVTATSVIGTSGSSPASAAVVPAKAPDAPTTVTGVPGNTAVTVSWLEPAQTGGKDVTGYTVTASPVPLAGAATCQTAALTCLVSGLSNGTSYTFTVTATNPAGTSGPSVASGGVIPATAPDAPALPATSAVAGDGEVVVTWIAPVSNGGSAVTGYTVTASPTTPGGVRTCATTTALTCAVAQLVNGTEYTFTVTATNIAATSVPSASSNTATPRGQSEAPLDVSGVYGNQQVSVSWDAPGSNGGNSIISYTVTPAHDGVLGDAGSPCTTLDGVTTTCDVTGLTNGVEYTFTVTAATSWGDSLPSEPSDPVIPKTIPGQPAITSAVAHDASVVVTWTAPTDDGGATVDEYTVTSLASAGTHDVRTCTVSALTCNIAQLDNGTTYTFTVTAKNSAGTSDPSVASSGATPLPVPAAPAGVGGASADSLVVVSWTAADGNGSPVTGYEVTASPLPATGTGTCTTTGALTCDVTSLVNGTSYTFTATATSVIGTSLPSSPASAAVVPAKAPDAPATVTAVPGSTEVAVSWLAPADNGGKAVTGYTVTASPQPLAGPATCQTASLTCTVTGLANGTPYTFTVTATSPAGTSGASDASADVTPASFPDAPAIPTVVAGDQLVHVTWVEPADGGTGILGYTVTASPATPTAQTCETTGALTCDVTQLANGTAYTFTVTSKNAVGTSLLASGASAGATPRGVPVAPATISAAFGDTKATVTWAAAGENGAAVTKYTVTSTPLGNICETADGTTLTCNVLNLVNGTEYSFKVTATNVAGTSDPSVASNTIVPAARPDAPTNQTAVSGNAQVTVSWLAPAATGGSPVTAYTVTSIPAPSSGTGTCSPVLPALTCTVTGLTNGDPYTFSVVTTTIAGDSVAAVTGSVTPAGAPGAPTDVTGATGDRVVHLSWNAPVQTNGSALVTYVVQYTTGTSSDPESNTWTTFTHPASTSTTLDVTGPSGGSGLSNGFHYKFRVAAVSGATSSTGAFSAMSGTVTPATTPNVPAAPTGSPGYSKVVLSWTALVAPNDGGLPISYYQVRWTTDVGVDPDLATWTEVATHFPSNEASITQLSNGTGYKFQVRAVNGAEVGTTAYSASSLTVTPAAIPPDAPGRPAGTRGNGSADLTWTAPTELGGSGIVDYIVEYSLNGQNNWEIFTHPASPATAITVSGLENGITYVFRVTGKNTAVGNGGVGSVSATSESVTPATTPGSPTGATAVRGDSRVELTWTAPSSTGGALITNYPIEYSEDSGPWQQYAPTSASNALSMSVTGLTNGKSYTFRVSATNSASPPTSSPSAMSAAVIPATVPAVPTAVTGTRNVRSVNLSWTAPTNNGGAAISDYRIQYSVNNGVSWNIYSRSGVSTNTSDVLVAGLDNGVQYRLRVLAINSVGLGAYSDPSGVVVPSTVPNAPTAVTRIKGNTQAELLWTAPADNGGDTIDDYKVEYQDITPFADQTWKVATRTPSALTSQMISGLTNYHTYNLRVSAHNVVGYGSTASSTSVTPNELVVPDQPTGVAEVDGPAQDRKVALVWTAPISDGGASVSNYKVEYTRALGTPSWTEFEHTASAATAITVTGLVNQAGYYFRVSAINSEGTGPVSDSSAEITPASPLSTPPAPGNLSGVAANGQVTLNWSAPNMTNIDPLIGYKVYVANVSHGPGPWPFVAEITEPTLTTYVVPGLTNGDVYQFKVSGVNTPGTGTPSAASVRFVPAVLSDCTLRGPNVILANCNLSGVNLNTIDFSGADFTGAILTLTRLNQTNLTGTKFNYATMNSTELVGANLTNTKFTWTNLSSAEATGATFTSTTVLANANMSSMLLTNNDLRNVDFRTATLSGANLEGANLDNARLDSVAINSAKFNSAIVTNANLTGVSGNAAQFNSATLTGSNLTNATLTGAKFISANLASLTVSATLVNVTMTGTNFQSADMSYANLAAATLTTAKLQSTTLVGATLTGVHMEGVAVANSALLQTANLTGAHLAGAVLNNANFDGATLTDADLAGAFLNDTRFVNTNLAHVVLTGAHLSNAQMQNATMTDTTLLDGANLTTAYMYNATLTGVTFAGADLSNATLVNANMTSANLQRTNLSGVNLTGATMRNTIWSHASTVTDITTLTNAILTGVDLHDTDLTGVLMTGAYLDRTNLRNAVLTSATLTRANLSAADLTEATLTSILGTDTYFIGADLTGADFTSAKLNRSRLYSAIVSADTTFAKADLTSAYLSSLNLTGIHFDRAILSSADFSHTILTGATLSSVTANSVNMTYATMTSTTELQTLTATEEYPAPTRTNFNSANFSLAVLAGADFNAVTATSSRWDSANLMAADFTGAELTSAGFYSSNAAGATIAVTTILTGSVWQSANLSGAHLGHSVFNNLSMEYVNLSGTTLSDVTLTSSRFSRANFAGATMHGTEANFATFNNADMTNADMTGAKLAGADMTYATLKGTILHSAVATLGGSRANWSYADLSGADLTSATLDNNTFWGATFTSTTTMTLANFTSANMTNANMYGAHLSTANLTTANLTNANLSTAVLLPATTLTGTRFLGVDLTTTTMTGAVLTNANLSGADLTDKDLTTVTLTGTDMTGTNLTDADLHGLTLLDMTLTNTILRRADLHGATFSGSTNMTYANVRNADLTDAVLNGRNLTSSNFSNATMVGTKLTSATLTNATLSGAMLNNAVLSTANLIGARMIGSTLTGATLTLGTNLSNADLTGATLTNVVSSGILGTPAVLPTNWSIVSGSLVEAG